MSNSPPPSKNHLKKLWNRIFGAISNQRLANIVTTYPLFLKIVVLLTPLASIAWLIIQNGYSSTVNNQNMNEDFKTKVCKKYERLVQERLEIEGNRNVIIDKISNVNNSDINQLPFSCIYNLQEGNKNFASQEIHIEFNPLFPDLTNDINNDFEEKINLEDVCTHETITKQMQEKAKEQGNYKDGDQIVPKAPVLLETKKDVYPVFRWVCSYDIKKQGENLQYFQGRNKYNIDIKLEPYCESKAKQKGTNRVKPTHHNYKDPYSLYCVDPHSKRNR